MNKTLFILHLIFCISFSAEDLFKYKARYWDECQQQTKDFSVYYDKVKSGSEVDQRIKNVFNCANKWFSTKYREGCEATYGLSQLEKVAQTFYTECYVPIADSTQSVCTKLGGCSEDTDRCTTCTTSPNNQKCISFKNGNSDNYQQYEAINDISQNTNCPDRPTFCVASLMKFALDACREYYLQKCLRSFIDANFSSDPCYASVVCDRQLTGYLLKFSAFAFLFFIFI